MAQAAKAAPTYRIQVLDRAFRVLEVLAGADGELGATELAARSRLHKTTAHRLLVILERQRFVERNPDNAKYRLGWRLFELGSLAVSRLDLYSLAKPYVESLMEQTGETARMAVLRGGEIISLVNAESRRNVRTPSTVGRRSPLYCTSQGKAILAHLPPETAGELIRSIEFKSYTGNTITRPSRLKTELAVIRERGYAIDDEEFEDGLRCIGAPVRNHLGEVVAGLSIAGPAFRVGGEQLEHQIRAVVSVSRQLSAALGFQNRRAQDRLDGQVETPPARLDPQSRSRSRSFRKRPALPRS
jgi:IclR family KDG regulon transcriptional repressor